MKDAAQALARIANRGAPFVSRGDGSGTHAKEKSLWQKAGLAPGGGWYLPAGQGMGETLNLAREKRAYTLSDRATFLSQKKPGLDVLVEGDPALLNVYHVIAVSPGKHPGVRHALAMQLVDYLTSLQAQELIARFGREEYGQSLFFPDSDEWREGKR